MITVYDEIYRTKYLSKPFFFENVRYISSDFRGKLGSLKEKKFFYGVRYIQRVDIFPYISYWYYYIIWRCQQQLENQILNKLSQMSLEKDMLLIK